MLFKDRYDAGYQLSLRLTKYKQKKDVIILAIPRGSLQIGYILAKELKVPLDIVLSKKIGAPGNPELAIGAVSLESYIVDPEYLKYKEYIENEVEKIRQTLKKDINFIEIELDKKDNPILKYLKSPVIESWN